MMGVKKLMVGCVAELVWSNVFNGFLLSKQTFIFVSKDMAALRQKRTCPPKRCLVNSRG